MNKKLIALVFFCAFILICIFAGVKNNVFPWQQDKSGISTMPNIVLINIDSLRADHMGVYGYEKNTTPFLDSLFRKGVVFENAVAAAPFTFQDDASIFSGLYPSQNNITDWTKTINKNYTLLPKILSYYGYSTAGFASPSMQSDQFRMGDSFAEYVFDPRMKNIAETKISVADKIKRTKTPLFIFWHVYDVHLPYLNASPEFYPQEYKGSLSPISDYFTVDVSQETPQRSFAWSNQAREGLCAESNDSDPTNIICERYVKITPEDAEYIKASYDTGIKYVDSQLAEFFDLIKNEPSYRNTLFIISAEHGEELGEHGLFFHGDVYNANLRIPLVFVHSKLKPETIKERVSSLDIMPTILSFVGIPKNEIAEGKDLSLLINGGTYGERAIFSERAPFKEYSVIKDGWKYILRDPLKKDAKAYEESYKDKLTPFMMMILRSDNDGNISDELYNLSDDPYERHNLIGKGYEREKELRQLVQEFKDKMMTARQNQEDNQALPNAIIQYP